MKEGLEVIFDEVKARYGSDKMPDGREVITRENAFNWVRDELGGLRPTSEQMSKAFALAQQLGAGDFALRMRHDNRLDFILDEITKYLTVEWIEEGTTYQEAKSVVFARIYGGDDGPDQAA